jgi:hypothetical protein
MTVESLPEDPRNLIVPAAWLPRSSAKNLIDASPNFRKLNTAP